MGAIIKTKQPVVIDTRRNISEILYFEIISENRNDKAEFKNQNGLYSYEVQIQVMRDGILVPAYKIYPTLTSIQATYKLSTWFTLFGEMTPNAIEVEKPALMIAQFVYNKADYWGLETNDYEVYNQ